PQPAAFPLEDLEAACRLVLQGQGDVALQYGGPQGYSGLREVLAQRIGQQEGMELGPGNFMLTGGAAQALANICFTFLDPGDVVVTENPTFTGSLRTIRAHQPHVVGVPLDGEGPCLDALALALDEAQRQGRRAKIIYLTPNFQNPTGITFSLARRQAIVALAARYRCLIAEDDAYGELRYDGQRLPSLFTLAGGQGVVRLGTFSKTIGPGLRLGWSLASQEVIQALVAMRLDMGTSPLTARLVAAYAADGRYHRHVEELIPFYRPKRDAMMAALERHCGSWAHWRVPEGGFFVWLELPAEADGDAVAAAALEEGVMVVPGASFFCQDPQCNYLRLSYSFIASDDVDEAVRRLACAAASLLV
ncbi:MAG: PLP-dependent aminotransferase family protein, partial [Dehalococcoidia bacterium]